MNTTPDPIGLFGKLNAGVLLAVTPEYPQIKKAGRPGAGRAESRPASFAMQPEYRTIDGAKIRCAEGGKQDGPVVLLLCPLPQSILCFDPSGRSSGSTAAWWRSTCPDSDEARAGWSS